MDVVMENELLSSGCTAEQAQSISAAAAAKGISLADVMAIVTLVQKYGPAIYDFILEVIALFKPKVV